MLMPDKNGVFRCEDKCSFATADIFEFMDHCGIEFGWQVRLNKRFSFDLYTFLGLLNDTVNKGDLDDAWTIIQDATLMMVNTSEGDLEEFVEETVVASEMNNMMSDLERLLKKDGDEKD